MSREDTRDAAQRDTVLLPPGAAPQRDPAADPERIGRYRVIGRLGAGGMGIVYTARDEELDRKVALKLLRHDDRLDGAGPARLKREAQALAKLSHPNVVHVYEVGQHEGQIYLAMELVQGRTLRSWQLGDHTWRDVVAMYVAAGRGLAAAHAAGIVHRDFKPDNVLVGADGRPRVLDFGLARPDLAQGPTVPPPTGRQPVHELTEAGTVLGTPAYMPPEQLEGLDVDARCDQFSFCVSLFEALHGTRPFTGKTIAELSASIVRGAPATVDLSRRGVPREVHAVIAQGLAADPRARHPDMPTLLAKLERATARRRGLRRWLAGFTTASILATGAVLLWPDADDPTASTLEPSPTDDPRAAILADSDLPPEVATPLPDDPLGVTVHRLANGLTVYLVPRPEQPMLRVSFAVRMGGCDEPPDAPGVHHMAAHMLDAGSLRLGSRDPEAEHTLLRERDDALQRLASTDDPQARLEAIRAVERIEREAAALAIGDERVAVLREAGAQRIEEHEEGGLVTRVEIPTPSLDLLLAVEADRMRNPSFRHYLAATDALLAELVVQLDGTRVDEQRARELLLPALGSHPTPAREAAWLSSLRYAEVKAAFARRFVPNNVAIVLVGDVEPTAVLGAVEAAFGDWAPAPVPARPPPPAAIPDRRVFESVVGTGGPRATVAFPLPPELRDDRRAVLLLVDVLTHAVPDPDGPLPSIETLQATIEGEVLVVTARPDARAELDDIEAEIVRLLETTAAGRLESTRVAEAVARRELAVARLATREHDMAATIAQSFVERRPWNAVVAELASPAVNDLSLAVAARALLDHGRIVVHRVEGRFEPPAIPRLPVQAREPSPRGRSTFASELLARPRSRIEPQFLLPGRHYTRREHDGVVVVTARADPPLVRAGVRWPVGVGHDWWACDAVTAHTRALRGELAREGVALEVDCDRNATTVRIETTQARFDAAWSRLHARLRETTLDDDEVRDHVEAALAARRRARRDPDRAFASLVELATWEEGGGIEHALPTDEALARINRTLLEASLQGVLETPAAVFYAGPDPTALGDRLPTPGVREAPVPRPWRARRPVRPQAFVVDVPRRGGAAIAVTLAAPTTADHDTATIGGRVLATRFVRHLRDAGDGGRVEDVAALLREGDASFVARAFVAEPRVAPAIETALALLGETIDRDALSAAVRSLEASLRADRVAPHAIPQTVLAWSSTADPRMATWERLGNADLDALAKQLVGDGAPTIAIAVDLDAIDLDALRTIADVTVVHVDDLCARAQ